MFYSPFSDISLRFFRGKGIDLFLPNLNKSGFLFRICILIKRLFRKTQVYTYLATPEKVKIEYQESSL